MDLDNVLVHIGTGKENAVTREKLCLLTGMTDRAIRATIEEAKTNGYVIINNGSGYYKPEIDEVEELRRYIKKQENRAKTIFRELRNYKAYLADIDGGRINE